MTDAPTLTVLKLGGSLITHKDEPESVDEDSLASAADAVGAFRADGRSNRLVVVHGGGSFGHHHAAEQGVSSTDGIADAAGLATVHRAMGELNDVVMNAFHERDLAALPVRPLSVAYRDGERLQFPAGAIETMLAEGFVPVAHGDVVAHSGKGGTVLSGDEIVVSLARSLGADRVGLCSTVPGVLDADGDVVSRVDSYGEVERTLGTSEATDVTGGMAGKVRQLLDLEATASVFGLDDLGTFLDTGTAGTVIGGSN
jgi:isopentenyl phosphate kinase